MDFLLPRRILMVHSPQTDRASGASIRGIGPELESQIAARTGHGVSVDAVSDGYDALQYFERIEYDLIIVPSEIGRPGTCPHTNGLEFIRICQIMNSGSCPPTIMMFNAQNGESDKQYLRRLDPSDAQLISRTICKDPILIADIATIVGELLFGTATMPNESLFDATNVAQDFSMAAIDFEEALPTSMTRKSSRISRQGKLEVGQRAPPEHLRGPMLSSQCLLSSEESTDFSAAVFEDPNSLDFLINSPSFDNPFQGEMPLPSSALETIFDLKDEGEMIGL